MSDLPLARIHSALALRYRQDLLVYAAGVTSGFGGRIVIERSPNLILPTEYDAREEPGNTGINPAASPEDVPTSAAYAFPGEAGSEILLTSSEGRQTLQVIEVVPGAVEDGEPGSSGAGVRECEWNAVHDFRTRPPRLRVEGTCIMPTPGYRLTLKPARPPGINPRILLLHLEVVPPTGVVPQVLTPTPVAYEEKTERHYEQVQITPGDTLVEVREVQ